MTSSLIICVLSHGQHFLTALLANIVKMLVSQKSQHFCLFGILHFSPNILTFDCIFDDAFVCMCVYFFSMN